MEPILIRKARLQDLGVLLEFEQGIIATERPFDETLKQGEIHYYDLAKMIVADDAEVIVAELNGEVIASGFARIAEAKDYEIFAHYGSLRFMFTRADHRGKGINNLILEALKVWAISRGMTELRLHVYDDNAPAIKAYEKAGFKPHLLEMRLSV